ncbi:MAG TPA: exodeoxyribonuclease V subunit gamma [Solirubrobacteraceae bacterium]
MLHIHRAERADGLVRALGELLAQPPDDPFAGEVVAVATRGMERWLAQQLSTHVGATPGRADGVCANVAFPTPRRLTGDAVAAASGIQPDADPWLADRLVWPLLEVVDDAIGEPWLHVLAAHLGADGDIGDAVRRVRRLSSVRHIATLFDRYALQRPAMLRAWARGESDGLAEDALWQYELWRRLRQRIGGGGSGAGGEAVPDPAGRLEHACRRLRHKPGLVDLPQRVSLFGLTRLPASSVEVLAALAAARDVHVFTLHPSPALWDRVAPLIADGAPERRDEDRTRSLPVNRLLASWGHDARELQLVLRRAGNAAHDHHHPMRAGAGDTLLHRIQADIRADRRPPDPPLPGDGDQRPPLGAHDRSIQVHACHGRSRQVDVLRDAILHLLAQDPTLEPRDVIVMCPDIEVFAPLIQATFGTARGDGGGDGGEGAQPEALPDDRRPPDLHVRLADRSLRQTNPVLGAIGALLGLAGGRVTASQVLDLADRRPVRRRFGLDDDDLARVEEWVAGSGIRWGLDAEHRRPFKLDAIDAGTWRAGLDRLLLGVATTESDGRLLGGVLALDDVDSGAIALAGRLAELVDRLAAALDGLATAQTISGWARAIGAAADALTATAPSESWQRAELQRLLDDVVAGATVAGTVNTTMLEPAEVRALLAQRLEGRPTRANFRTGHLTFCTLTPMRSVPHRVVCLLGLDDGAFPRRTARDGDDLILDEPHVGDRDARTEDRQLLLDALLAATDRLVVTYTGNDERTNLERPAAVPVGELLDAIDATVRGADGRRARERVVVRHPLQPFDPRNFVASTATGGAPWSFDRGTLDGARALTGPRAAPAPFLAGPLPANVEEIVALDDLVAFVEHPARAFLRQRLHIRAGDRSDEVEDALPVELDALEQYAIGQHLLERLLAGVALDDAIAAEKARGRLPPGNLAGPVVQRLRATVEGIARQARVAAGEDFAPRPVDVGIALAGDRRLAGTVADVGAGAVVRAVAFSRVGPRHRLGAWVRMLALTAVHPDQAPSAVTIGRARRGARDAEVTVARLPALAGDAATRRAFALEQLAMLVDLRDRGLREPLPLACLSSAAYARAAMLGKDAERAAREQWSSRFDRPGEDAHPAHVLVFGPAAPFDDLLAQRPRDDESGDGWESGEPTRFGRYARRLWSALLEHERVSDL